MATLTVAVSLVQPSGGENIRFESGARALTLVNNSAVNNILHLPSGATDKISYLRSENMATLQDVQEIAILVDPDNTFSDGVASPDGEVRCQITWGDSSNGNLLSTPWLVARREVPILLPGKAYTAKTGGTALVLNEIEVKNLSTNTIKVRSFLPG